MWKLARFFLVLFVVLGSGAILFKLGEIMDGDLSAGVWRYALPTIGGLVLWVVAALVLSNKGKP